MNLAIISFHIWKILIEIYFLFNVLWKWKINWFILREVKIFYLKYTNEFNYIFGIELEGLSKIYKLVEKE